MSVLWTIVVGFVAGVIAKLLHPGPNEFSGFVLTNHPRDRGCVRRDVPRPGDRLVSCRRGGRVHRFNCWSCDRSARMGLSCSSDATRVA